MKNIFQTIKRIESKIQRNHIFIAIIALLSVFNIAFAYNNLQNTFPIVGLKFDGFSVMFSSQKSLQRLISEEAVKKNTSITFSYQGKPYTISQQDVGYTINPGYTANAILLIGRKGTLLQKLWTQVAALCGFENIHANGTFSNALVSAKILEIQQAVNHTPIPIHPDFTHNPAITLPAQNGTMLDTQKFVALLQSHFSDATSSTTLPLPIKIIPAQQYTESELTPIRNDATHLTQQPITIVAAGHSFTLSTDNLKNLLTVVERPDPQNPKQTKLALRLDDTRLTQQLGTFAAQVESLTRTEFNYEDALAVIYGQFYFHTRAISVIPTGQIPGNSHVLGAQTSANTSASNSRKIAYLTFDDGPNTIYHPLILAILKQYHVKATFFLIGQNVLAAKDVAIQTYKDGHLVGNHTLTHAFLPNYTSAFISNEMITTNTILQSINGNQPVKFFRPPYGGTNATVIQDAHALNLNVFLWDVDPRDWSEPPKDVLIHRVIDYVHSGSNVLMHSNHSVTVQALPTILQTLISEGYTFQTLDTYPVPEEL